MALTRPAASGVLKPPADERQATRLRRFWMGAGTSLLVCATLFACAELGLLPWRSAIEGTGGIVGLIALFYALFRSGLNLRFADPSLTTEQCVSAALFLTYIMYHAGPAREALALFYPVVMLFGVLRLNASRLMALALITLAAHATMLIFALMRDASMNAGYALTEFCVLMIVLPWFAVMGGYVNGLRERLAASHRELGTAYERIERLAMRDELTGTYNRRYMMELLERERARSERLGRPLSVCLLDVDHFKSVNDTLGHAAGDAVLRGLAPLLGAGMRTADVLGRIGGEEFLMVLPETGIAGAQAVAERARAAVERAHFDGLPEGRRITVTLGIAEAALGEAPAVLLARADGALYAGKGAGRNRVALG